MKHLVTNRISGLVLMTIAYSAAQAGGIRVYVDGDEVNFADQGPRMMNQRVCVPLRGVFERLGATVDWNDSDQTITCEKQTKRIWLKIGDPDARVDGKDVRLDQPAVLYRQTTMVPLRFVSESLGADVHWNEALQAVHITMAGHSENSNNNNGGTMRDIAFSTGTVVPVTLDQALSSNDSQEGDRFTATVGSAGQQSYANLPVGTLVMGHVTSAKAKTNKAPGVLAVEFDSIMTPNGMKYPVRGSVIGLDEKSVERKDGMIVARNTKSNNDHKSVWIGAGAGAIIAIVTKNNLLTGTLVGAGLGYIYDLIDSGKSKSNDVRLDKGSAFGVRMDSDFMARVR
ncbi:MAG: copper amine oxidase N-terminal domain-containing protein [Chthonomonadaceae bacterium]|nr:copper amine oxidase N-terminal domain-containing protein [Chthonomonadaceae bacterium]